MSFITLDNSDLKQFRKYIHPLLSFLDFTIVIVKSQDNQNVTKGIESELKHNFNNERVSKDGRLRCKVSSPACKN